MVNAHAWFVLARMFAYLNALIYLLLLIVLMFVSVLLFAINWPRSSYNVHAVVQSVNIASTEGRSSTRFVRSSQYGVQRPRHAPSGGDRTALARGHCMSSFF